MKSRIPSTISIVAVAVGEAEDALEGLPLTAVVRHLQARTVAFRSALVGLTRGLPKLTREQRARLVDDVVRLAVEAQAVARDHESRAKSEAG